MRNTKHILILILSLLLFACTLGGLVQDGSSPAGTTTPLTETQNNLSTNTSPSPEPSPTPIPQTESSTIYKFRIEYGHELLVVDYVNGLVVGNSPESVSAIVSNYPYRYKMDNYLAANMAPVEYSIIGSDSNLDSAFVVLRDLFTDRDMGSTTKTELNGREVIYATATIENWPLNNIVAMSELDDSQVVILVGESSLERDLPTDIQTMLTLLTTAEPDTGEQNVQTGDFYSPLYNFHFTYPQTWQIIYSPAYNPNPGYGGQLVLADTSDFNTLEGGHFRASLSVLPIPGNITCSYGLSETATPVDFQQARIEQIESGQTTGPTIIQHNGTTIWRTELIGSNNTVLLYTMPLENALFTFEVLLNDDADQAALEDQFLDLVASFEYRGETTSLLIHNRIRSTTGELLSEAYTSRTGVAIAYPAGWEIQISDPLGNSMQDTADEMGLNFGEQLFADILFGEFAPDTVVLQSPSETFVQITIPSRNILSGGDPQYEEFGTQMGLLMNQMMFGIRFDSDWYEAIDGFCFRLRDSTTNGNVYLLQPEGKPYELFNFMAIHPEYVSITERDSIISIAAKMMANLAP